MSLGSYRTVFLIFLIVASIDESKIFKKDSAHYNNAISQYFFPKISVKNCERFSMDFSAQLDCCRRGQSTITTTTVNTDAISPNTAQCEVYVDWIYTETNFLHLFRPQHYEYRDSYRASTTIEFRGGKGGSNRVRTRLGCSRSSCSRWLETICCGITNLGGALLIEPNCSVLGPRNSCTNSSDDDLLALMPRQPEANGFWLARC